MTMSISQVEGLFAVIAGIGVVLGRHAFARGYLHMRVGAAQRLPWVGAAIRGEPESRWEGFLGRWPLIVAWIVGLGWILLGGAALLGG